MSVHVDSGKIGFRDSKVKISNFRYKNKRDLDRKMRLNILLFMVGVRAVF